MSNYIYADYYNNEYFLTPNKEIIEVRLDDTIESPYDCGDFMFSHGISAYDNPDKIEEDLDQALYDAIPENVLADACIKYLEKRDIRCEIQENSQSHIEIYDNKNDELLVELQATECFSGNWEEDKDFLGDCLAVALDPSCEGYAWPEFSVSDLIEEGLLNKEDYIITSGPHKSTVNMYTEFGGYMTMDDIKKEYGDITPENIELAKKALSYELKLYEEYIDGNTFMLNKYSISGELTDENIAMCYGSDDVFLYIPENSEYLGTYGSIEECLEENEEKFYGPIGSLISGYAEYKLNFDNEMINFVINGNVYLDAPLIFNEYNKIDLEMIVDCVKTAAEDPNLTEYQAEVLNDFAYFIGRNYEELAYTSLEDKLTIAESKAASQEVSDKDIKTKDELEI